MTKTTPDRKNPFVEFTSRRASWTAMHRFRTRLVAGKKPPYIMWTFLIVPGALARQWGAGPKAVRGTLSGNRFRGTASRGEGVLRVAIARDILDRAGVRRGITVDVALERDLTPRPIRAPKELRAVFDDNPEVAA